MHLFSFAKPVVKFITLKQINDPILFGKCLDQVNLWFTSEWGYIHDKDKHPVKALEDRKKYLDANSNRIHLAFYGDILIGAYRVENKEFDKELLDNQIKKGWQDKLITEEIWFIYVDPGARGLGVGRQIVKEIKQCSLNKKAGMVLLETLKPGLNRLYKTENAEVIGENSLDSNPTDVLRINLK